MAICGLNYAAIYRHLDKQRKARGMSWRQVAAEVDVPPGTFTRLSRGQGVSDETFVSLMHWLGTDESILPFLRMPAKKRVAPAEPEEPSDSEE